MLVRFVAVSGVDGQEQPWEFGTCLFGLLCGDMGQETLSVVLKSQLAEPESLVTLRVDKNPSCDGGNGSKMKDVEDNQDVWILGHSKTCPVAIHPTIPPRPEWRSRLRLAVAVVIRRPDGHVLLTERAAKLRSFAGAWVVPGGHVDKGETLKEAGCREVWEEVGLEIAPHQLRELCLWESCYPAFLEWGEPVRQHLVLYYLVDLPHAPVTTGSGALNVSVEEVSRYGWYPPPRAVAQTWDVYRSEPSEDQPHTVGPTSISLESVQDWIASGTRFAMLNAAKRSTFTSLM
jgi:8-oxo-dGTP diphosphatase